MRHFVFVLSVVLRIEIDTLPLAVDVPGLVVEETEVVARAVVVAAFAGRLRAAVTLPHVDVASAHLVLATPRALVALHLLYALLLRCAPPVLPAVVAVGELPPAYATRCSSRNYMPVSKHADYLPWLVL